tara:strand:- start:3322 stop:4440 length:1119 start_codon:yes stop_codon:yes gene_type:complete
MKQNKITYAKPSITDLEISYASDAAKNGWGDECYKYLNKFEDLFKDHIKTNYAISTSSCTGALHMGMSALGIGQSDEVIMADTNWIATASPVVQLGAKPVFVDILSDSWCIDPEKAEAAITKNTKAIVATHLYGNLCNMDALLDIGKRHNIAIIEDSAEAIGSVYKGNRAGSMGTFSSFSFHGTKTLTTGEGGMFLTNDEELYEKVFTLSNHGRARGQTKQFWPDVLGYKFKMSNIQAAIGCAQVERIKDLIEKKRFIYQKYKTFCDNYDFLSINIEQSNCKLGCWMPNIVFSSASGITRELMLKEFKLANIDARVFFWPLSSLSMFDDQLENKVAYDIPTRSINLPSYHDITDNEIEMVTNVLEKLIKRYV